MLKPIQNWTWGHKFSGFNCDHCGQSMRGIVTTVRQDGVAQLAIRLPVCIAYEGQFPYIEIQLNPKEAVELRSQLS